MPQLLQNFTSLQLLKLSTTLILCLFFLLPFLFFAFIFISFLFFVTSPFLCAFTSAYLFFQIVHLYPFKSLVMKLMNLCARMLFGNASKSVKDSKAEENVEGIKDKQVSLDLDSWEFPSLNDSEKEEEDEEQGKGESGEQKLSNSEEDSWQILVPKSGKKFHETLSFWRRKERGW